MNANHSLLMGDIWQHVAQRKVLEEILIPFQLITGYYRMSTCLTYCKVTVEGKEKLLNNSKREVKEGATIVTIIMAEQNTDFYHYSVLLFCGQKIEMSLTQWSFPICSAAVELLSC